MDLEQKLMPIVDKAIQAIETTGDFVVTEAPLLLQEFLRWKTFEHGTHVFGGLFLLILVPVILSRIFGKKTSEGMHEPYKIFNRYFETYCPGVLIPFVIGTMITVVIGCVNFFVHIMQLIKVLVAPKIYIIEYFTQVVQN